MHRPGIAVDSDLVGAVDKFIDPLTIGDADRIFGQRFGDGNIIDFLETASPLAFQRAGSGYKDDRRALAPCYPSLRAPRWRTLQARQGRQLVCV